MLEKPPSVAELQQILQRRNFSRVTWRFCQLLQTQDCSSCCQGWHNRLSGVGGTTSSHRATWVRITLFNLEKWNHQLDMFHLVWLSLYNINICKCEKSAKKKKKRKKKSLFHTTVLCFPSFAAAPHFLFLFHWQPVAPINVCLSSSFRV